MPRFSIVMPCYNAERWLAAGIRSCLAQTARDLEVIVVDDGSIDESYAVARREAAADARVKVIRQQNRGVGAARNAGLAIAAGEYINFLDADDLFDPEKLAVQGAVLDDNPGIDCVLCDGRAIDGDGRVVLEHLIDARRLAGPVALFDLFFSGGQFPPLVPLLRRRVALAVGGFDEDRRMSGWADTEFWLRVGLTNARHHFVDRCLCQYRLTAGNMSSNHAAMELAAELAYAKVLRDRPTESARALRFLHGQLQDNDAAMAGLRTCVAHAEQKLRVLNAERVDVQHLRHQINDANDRLRHLRELVVRPLRAAGKPVHRERSGNPMQRVVICGTGETGRRLWEALAARPTVNVVSFVDAGVRWPGQTFLGTPVHAPEWLRSGEWDRIAVTEDDSHTWRAWLKSAGLDPRALMEFPAGPEAAGFDALAEREFPDPLAAVLAAMPPASGLRVGIFGTGTAGLKIWEALAGIDTVDAVWFADNNPTQQGSTILGLKVISPVDIVDSDVDLIAVGSLSREPIRKQLIALGVRPEAILTPNASAPIDDLRRELSSTLIAFVLEQAS